MSSAFASADWLAAATQQRYTAQSATSTAPPAAAAAPLPPPAVLPGGSAAAAAAAAVHQQLQELEARLGYVERREQEGWAAAAAQLARVAETAEGTSKSVALLEAKASKDIQFVEERLAADLEAETAAREAATARLREAVASEAATVQRAVDAAGRQRHGDLERRIAAVAAALEELTSVLEQRLEAVAAEADTAAARAHEEAGRIEGLVAAVREERRAGELQLMGVLEEACVQLHRQVVEERNARVESQRSMERMLQELTDRTWVSA